MKKPLIGAVAPWYGSGRTIGPAVGKLLEGCSWVGIPFAGGMCEVPHIEARTILCNDLHRHVINLAAVLASPVWGPKLYRRLRRHPFHPDELKIAQERMVVREAAGQEFTEPDLPWAEDYFIAVWMGRSAKAGTSDEFSGSLAVRYNAGGGDSAVRYRNAIASISAWRWVLAKCTFSTLDVFPFLAKCCNEAEDPDDVRALYCDPPFLVQGSVYKQNCGNEEAEQIAWHRTLAAVLNSFTTTRVVVRAYDHPLVRELYPESHWTWHRTQGRKQSNEVVAEVLVCSHRNSP